MATKNCPFCGERIKSEAVLCRFCHSKLDGAKVSEAEQPTGEPVSRQSFFQGNGVIISLLFLGFVGVVFVAGPDILHRIAPSFDTSDWQRSVAKATGTEGLDGGQRTSAANRESTTEPTPAVKPAPQDYPPVESLPASSSEDSVSRSQVQQDALEAIRLLDPDDPNLEKDQPKEFRTLSQRLVLLRLSDRGQCADIVQAKIDTPFFLRDEVAKALVQRVGSKELSRMLTLLRAREDDQQFRQVAAAAYPKLSPDDAAATAISDTKLFDQLLGLVILDSTNLIDHYCKIG